MVKKSSSFEVPVDMLKWTPDPKRLSISSTNDLEPQQDIIGQKRGVEAFRFGLGMAKKGYKVLRRFVWNS